MARSLWPRRSGLGAARALVLGPGGYSHISRRGLGALGRSGLGRSGLGPWPLGPRASVARPRSLGPRRSDLGARRSGSALGPRASDSGRARLIQRDGDDGPVHVPPPSGLIMPWYYLIPATIAPQLEVKMTWS